MRKSDFIKDESGSVSVLEATFVYPIVILMVAAMIFIGVYVLEVTLLDLRTQMTADMIAKNISFAGYDELVDVYNLTETADGPGKPAVNRAYDDREPYRYLGVQKADSRYEDSVKEYVSGLFFNSAAAECNIEIKRQMFGRKVIVSVHRDVKMPGFFSLAGLSDEYRMSVSSSALTSDSAEFVRNTDLTVETVNFISEKTRVKDKFSDMRDKISEILKSLKADSGG